MGVKRVMRGLIWLIVLIATLLILSLHYLLERFIRLLRIVKDMIVRVVFVGCSLMLIGFCWPMLKTGCAGTLGMNHGGFKIVPNVENGWLMGLLSYGIVVVLSGTVFILENQRGLLQFVKGGWFGKAIQKPPDKHNNKSQEPRKQQH